MRATASFLRIFGWLVVLAAVLALGTAIYTAFSIRPTPPTFVEQVNKALSLAVPAGVLLALGGLLLSKAYETTDANEKTSLFYLESCVHAYEEARNLLADGNNDRGTWIAAARALKNAQGLSKNVSVDAHLRVLELHRLKYRRCFNEILSNKPAAFFYGTADPSVPLEVAAAASSAPDVRAGRTVTSTARELSEKSLYAVWEAAQWPTDYRDPLDTEFSKKEEGSLLVLFPGLYDYLEHTRNFRSASGRIFRREPDKKQ